MQSLGEARIIPSSSCRITLTKGGKQKRILSIIGFLLIIISMLIVSVSAFIIQPLSNTMMIKLNQGILGNILEGHTLHYTPSNTSYLDDIIQITTNQADVHLFFNTDLDVQNCNYATYKIDVKVGDIVPVESEFSKGDIVTTLTLSSPDTASGIVLDAEGDWTIDFEITTTAKSVNSNQESNVNIIVSSEVNST